MISEDAENDAKNFDGQQFTGKTVGTYFGNHGASIASLAEILQEVLSLLSTGTTGERSE